MRLFRKLQMVLGLKGLLCLFSMMTIAVALISYTADVTINPIQQLTQGATTATWTVYVNDVDEVRYLPGTGTPAGSVEPDLDAADPGTYAFNVVTDGDEVCAVKIELTSAVSSSKFSRFEIRVKYWQGQDWRDETLYDAATGSTTKSYIDGLTGGDAGYVHQDASITMHYLIYVTYSYDLVDETSPITVTFQYTPLPQESF
ncbi:MAG: hypothetical protein NWF14_07065 [Candidatus Bathyarchaeota archaeon]|nr:hypothetical protein [Candidatus Bathyarchaeota archaeon]